MLSQARPWLLLAVLAAFVAVGYSQSCQFRAGETSNYFTTVSCINSIPYSSGVAEATIQTIQRAMKLYAFRDIARNSPNPTFLPSQVDIDAGLMNISQTHFETDFSFHDAVSNLLNTLRDAHTRYVKPDCYANFIWRLNPPVSFSSVLMNGQQVIMLNDPTNTFNGRMVTQINGLPAVKALFDWGVRVGRDSLDLGTRFNQALKAFSARPLATYGIPESAGVDLTFYGSSSPVTLPWVAYSSRNISDRDALSSLCRNYNTEIRNGSIPYIDSFADETLPADAYESRLHSHRTALQQHIETMHREAEEAVLQASTTAKAETSANRRQSGSTRPQAVSKTNYAALANPQAGDVIYQSVNLVFSIVKPGVGALKIPSFFPSEFGLDTIYSIKSIPEFLFDMQRVYVLAYDLDIRDMIIDLRGNGGGWICLAMEFLRILFPGQKPAGESFDLISSPLLRQIADEAAKLPRDVYSIFSPWKYFNPATMTPYATTAWLVPGKTHYRGFVSGTYSDVVTDDCSMVDIPAWNPKYLFSPSHVLVLTDGTCGSACALVARNIQERKMASTMVVGGILNRPQMVASFIGGLVYDLPTLLEELKLLKLSNSVLAPQPFPTSANLKFTLWEQYPWEGVNKFANPAEFVFEPAEYRIMYTADTVNNNTALYQYAFTAWKTT